MVERLSDLTEEMTPYWEANPLRIEEYHFNVRTLIPLDEFNNLRASSGSDEPVKNGIECPDCKSELYDSNPNMTLLSNPPKKDVHCKCGFKGYRLV